MHDLTARVAMLERLLAALARRQGSAIAFSRSTAPPIDTGAVQTIQGQMDALSSRDAMPVLFHYGFSSAMPVGGDKVVAYLDATRSSPVVVATGHQTYRLKGLATGEVAIYDMWGRSLKLGSSGVAVNANGAAVTISNATTVTVNASATIALDTPVVAASTALTVGNGATGTFTATGGVVVTVTHGIVTNIS